MFETSSDIFYLVASLAIVVLSVFVTIALYHTIAILKRINELMEMTEEGISTISEKLRDATERVVAVSGYVKVISQAAQSMIAAYRRRVEGSEEEEETPKRKRR